MHSTFDAVVDGRYPYPWISRVFLYTFQLLGMTSILNICIFIIEGSIILLVYLANSYLHADAYHIAKHLAEQDHQTQRQQEKEKEQKKMSETEPLNIQQNRYVSLRDISVLFFDNIFRMM